MEVTNNLNIDAGMFAFNKAKEVKNNEVLSALGMTPETKKAQEVIDSTIKQGVAQATGQGLNIDFRA